MQSYVIEIPEIELHLKRLTENQKHDLVNYAKAQDWDSKDFHQISEELETFIHSRSPLEEKYSELLYILTKMLFFAGNLTQLNDLYTEVASLNEITGVRIFYSIGLSFQGHTKEALELINSIDLDKFKNDHLITLETLGISLFIYSIQRNYGKVLEYYNKIMEYTDSLKITEEEKAHLLSWCYIRYAYTIRNKGRTSEAIEVLEKYQEYLNDFQHRFFQAKTFLRIGHCLHNMARIDEALDYYDQAVDIANDIQSWLLLSILYNRIGFIMNSKRKSKLAKEFFDQAVYYAKKSGAEWLIIGPLANLAQWKLSKGNINEAINDYHQFVDVASRIGDEQELCYALIGLANLYELIEDLPKSKYYLSKGLNIGLRLGIIRVVPHPEDENN